jgi:hypothetical protein
MKTAIFAALFASVVTAAPFRRAAECKDVLVNVRLSLHLLVFIPHQRPPAPVRRRLPRRPRQHQAR